MTLAKDEFGNVLDYSYIEGKKDIPFFEMLKSIDKGVQPAASFSNQLSCLKHLLGYNHIMDIANNVFEGLLYAFLYEQNQAIPLLTDELDDTKLSNKINDIFINFLKKTHNYLTKKPNDKLCHHAIPF